MKKKLFDEKEIELEFDKFLLENTPSGEKTVEIIFNDFIKLKYSEEMKSLKFNVNVYNYTRKKYPGKKHFFEWIMLLAKSNREKEIKKTIEEIIEEQLWRERGIR